jgi:hypothetical protein
MGWWQDVQQQDLWISHGPCKSEFEALKSIIENEISIGNGCSWLMCSIPWSQQGGTLIPSVMNLNAWYNLWR